MKLVLFLIAAFFVCYLMAGCFRDWILALPVSLFYMFGVVGLLMLYQSAQPGSNPGAGSNPAGFFVAGIFMVVLAICLLEFMGWLGL